MARFFARVELHQATSAQYEDLHEKMRAISFFRLIIDQSENNRHIPLPTGCYIGFSDESIDATFRSVRKVSDGVTTLNKVYCAQVGEERFVADF